jgi:hypothetical protein
VHPFLDQAAADTIFQNTRREMESPHRSPEEFVRALRNEMAGGHAVALADVAFVNGADLILGNRLVRHPEITQLHSYGGWNTAGNTLGTVLAQAVLRLLSRKAGGDPEQTRAHLEFLFLRFLDDYAYQARERTRILLEDLPALGLTPGYERLPSPAQPAIQDRLRSRLEPAATELEQVFIRSGLVKQVQVSNYHLPWQRLFEVGFEVKVMLA